MNIRNLIVLFMVTTGLFAQSVMGTVYDSNSRPLEGANVVLVGTGLGDIANEAGAYSMISVPAGSYELTASFIGYSPITKTIVVGGEDVMTHFILEVGGLALSDVEVLASRASVTTPVAYTNVTKEEFETRLGSQDIPMILNTTPSVYATQQGGGAGDARINIRGFNQRNIAVMINGVPQNDMENGWVYWSNWDGVGDTAASIQVQRGLSAVNLATPSIGGTMNIITDPTQQDAGVYYKTEMGSGNFQKQTLYANTGLIDDKFALTVGGVRKTGDGIVD